MENKKKLFIGNLPYTVTGDDLEAAFSEAGTVTSAQIVTERETGRARGFGFVEMETEEMAQAAIDMWNEKELKGRTIFVNVARPKTERQPRY